MPHYFVQEILDIVNCEVEHFDAVALATAMHRLGSMPGAPNLHDQITRSPEFYKLLTKTKERAGEMGMRDLATVVSALARICYHPDDDVMRALCREIAAKVLSGNSQNVANVLWALSAMAYRPEDEVLETLVDTVRARMREFTSQHISNIVLAFAKLEYARDQEMLTALGQEALAKLTTFTAQALSNTLWGLSKLGISNGELFISLSDYWSRNFKNFSFQDLVRT